MTWNYRVLRHPPDGDDDFLMIHEVYYDEKGTARSYTADGVAVCGESRDSLRWVLQKMLEAVDKPALYAADFPNAEKL